MEDREEPLTMEEGRTMWAGPLQRTCFAESSTKRSRRLVVLRKRKQRSQCTVEAKRTSAKEESTLWRARYKVCSLFMFD